MSYLESPRIHFAGRFQADTSTVNNDVRHFYNDLFQKDFQQPMVVQDNSITQYNGYWNPEGTGAWRLLGCRVTAAVFDGKVLSEGDNDSVVGMVIGGSNDRVAAKLVDLDPQQQGVSQIWGLHVRLEDDDGVAAFSSDFAVAPLCDLWQRQQQVVFFEQTLAAAYQSVLKNVTWSDSIESPCLRALQECTAEGLLSIRINVFGFDRTPNAPDYCTGRVVGTIGPAGRDAPRHFVLGRQLIVQSDQGPLAIQAAVDEAAEFVHVDFGNALPMVNAHGDLQNLGSLALGVLHDVNVKQGAALDANQVEILGEIPYREKNWLFHTAGIVDFPIRTSMGARAIIDDHPLAVLQQASPDQYTVLNRETGDGIFVRSDAFVFRMNPGDSATVDFYATQYGRPLAAAVCLQLEQDLIGGAGTNACLPPEYPVPDVNVPAETLTYPSKFQIGADGHASVAISARADGPQNPRKYIDGQVFALGYQITDLPDGYIVNPGNFISILAWDKFDRPAQPTWFQHVRPILAQYGNLYPVMSAGVVDLGNYDSVVAHLELMKLALSLPSENPNHMPVTRDLSDAKRQTLMQWLNSRDPSTGLPPLGSPTTSRVSASSAAQGLAERVHCNPNESSKAEVLRHLLRHTKR